MPTNLQESHVLGFDMIEAMSKQLVSQESEESEEDNDNVESETEDVDTAQGDYLEHLEHVQAEAIKHQLKAKLQYELKAILPRLHGIHSLLQEAATGTTIVDVPELSELFSLSLLITEKASSITTSMHVPKRPHKRQHSPESSSRPKRLLPPSPERTQKRKPSRAIF
ncbi:MAG TPA: hypothetical protein VGO47_13060 [Chlamydiales bacterium]|nr:hypothetical protein [Chlamydiales bacterium]